jgi:hypothetical protein
MCPVSLVTICFQLTTKVKTRLFGWHSKSQKDEGYTGRSGSRDRLNLRRQRAALARWARRLFTRMCSLQDRLASSFNG